MVFYLNIQMELLKNLNKKQTEAATHLDGPLLIIAGAGSGKTKALTHRLAYLISTGIDPENILALTFTNKAAQEMRNRVSQLIKINQEKTFVGTFHSLAVRILRREIPKIGFSSNFVIYDEDDSLSMLKDIMAELAVDTKQFKPSSIMNAISSQKNELATADAYEEKAGEFYEKIVAKIYKKYEDRLKEANALDFDDLLMALVTILKKFPETLEKYQNKYKYILVDEYQDTNTAQYVLLNLLAQAHQNLCVVGDDWQSIYRFRGSDFRNMLKFEKDYPAAKIVFLEENYRSTQNILDAAHAVIEKNVYKTNKKLWTGRGPGEKIKIVESGSEIGEASFIVQEIKNILSSPSSGAQDLNDFVVLYRTNAQSRALEEAIIREGWPYRMVGALKFYDRREIKDIIAYLRLIQNENDIISLKRIINTPVRGIGKATLAETNSAGEIYQLPNSKIKLFLDILFDFKKVSKELKVSRLIGYILEKIKYKDYILSLDENGESRWENAQELMGVAAKFDALTPPEGINLFLEEVALTASADDVSDERGQVNLMTLHSAKGLEFSVVFIAGAEEGLLPHQRSIFDPQQMEEERRLCYVGITRAKNKAYLIFTRRRSLYGKTQANLPSRFLNDIPENLIEFSSSNERLID